MRLLESGCVCIKKYIETASTRVCHVNPCINDIIVVSQHILFFLRFQTTLAHGRVAHGSLFMKQLVLSPHNDPPRNAASCFLRLGAYLCLVFYSFKS